jgi:hypothetical protein
MADRELRELQRRVARLQRGRGVRFPTTLRDQIAAWVRDRRAHGDWWCDLSGAIGIAPETLKRWAMPRADGALAMLPVDVIDAAPAGTVTIVSPTGLRVEGIAIADAIAILRGLA